jgi:4-hydroxybenzoate polyprenyltransferase
MIQPTRRRRSGRALFVDLDGTVTASDMLADAIVLAIKKNPLDIVRLILWVIGGRAHLKRRLAERITPDVARLPYRSEVIDFLSEQRTRSDRRIVLATASDALWADRVSRQVDLFDDVIASNGEVNLKGRAKLEAIQAYCRQHDIQSFDYIGDSRADVPIWQAAATALAIDPDGGALRSLNDDERLRFTGRGFRAKAVLLAMRPQQWVKNLLLLTPLMMAHQLTNLPRLLSALAAVIAFSLCASAIYVVNDMLDSEADRLHPTKKRRPFASGRLSIAAGPPLALALLGLGSLVALVWLPRNFQLVLASYVVLTTLYSFWLKSKVMIDVVLLAVLYTLRVLAGGMATDLVVSEWMMSFSMFIFTSLAFAKRYSELRRLASSDHSAASMGRGYHAMDLQMLGSVGPASGYLSVLVLALYLNSEQVTELYVQPLRLWPLCPLMLYWIGRLWIVAGRGELPDDPVAYTVTDRRSWIVAVCAGIVLLAAI